MNFPLLFPRAALTMPQMTGLPMPPPAYWDNVPWWAFIGLLAIIAIFGSPVLIQAIRGRGAAYSAREAAFNTDRAGFEGVRREWIQDIKASEREARAALVQERAERKAERDALQEDLQRGWDLGRGMEDEAHRQRHMALNLVMRFNALLGMFGDVANGAMLQERVRAIYAQLKPAEEPPPVPPLHDVTPRKP